MQRYNHSVTNHRYQELLTREILDELILQRTPPPSPSIRVFTPIRSWGFALLFLLTLLFVAVAYHPSTVSFPDESAAFNAGYTVACILARMLTILFMIFVPAWLLQLCIGHFFSKYAAKIAFIICCYTLWIGFLLIYYSCWFNYYRSQM